MAKGIVFLAGLTSLAVASASAWAAHEAGCLPGEADSATYNKVVLAGDTFYLEERNVPPPLNLVPPLPGSGHVFGDGTWGYQEANGVPGLQRGGCGGIPMPAVQPDPPFKAAQSCWPICILSEDLVCFYMLDPLIDENCGHGPDLLRL